MRRRKHPVALLREILGVSYEELAEKLRASPDHVRHWGAGLCGPMRTKTALRAAALSRGRISAEEFVFGRLRPRRRRAS